MKHLFLVLCFAAAPVFAQSELVAIVDNGRVEHYWVMYQSTDGRMTKIKSATSGIHFFVETAYLKSVTLAPKVPMSRTIRIRRRE